LAACALLAYGAILIRFVVFKAIPTLHLGHLRFRFAHPHTGPANLIPFKTILSELGGRGNHLINIVNLLGNILPFLPIGLLTPLVFPSFSWQKALALGLAIGLSFELMEILFHVGIFDVDDIMLNALGVVAGYGLFVQFKPKA
jgi:glycopeptide antibiotics resistance protein